MGATAVELIDPRRPDDAVRIYSGTFGWPLSVGHRHRPRQGCTCQQARECPVPGAHPVPNAPVFHAGEDVARVLGQSPGAGLIAWTVTFDALVVPRTIGMAAMITLLGVMDRGAACNIIGQSANMLLALPRRGGGAGRSSWARHPSGMPVTRPRVPTVASTPGGGGQRGHDPQSGTTAWYLSGPRCPRGTRGFDVTTPHELDQCPRTACSSCGLVGVMCCSVRLRWRPAPGRSA